MAATVRIKTAILSGLLLLLLGCASAPTPDPMDAQVSGRWAEVREGTRWFIRPNALLHVNQGPDHYSTLFSYVPAGVGTPLEAAVLGRQGDWVRVGLAGGTPEQGDPVSSGWIPAWYLVSDRSPSPKIKMVAPTLKVVARPAKIRLFPGSESPVTAEREPGQVVRLRRTWGGWGFVELTVYSVPGVHDGWMLLIDLAPLAASEPREGVIEQGKPIWPGGDIEATKGSPVVNDYPQYVAIEEQRDGLVLISAHGGWSAWAKKEDIIPDPWWGRTPGSVTSETDCGGYSLPEGAQVYMVATDREENTITLSFSTGDGGQGTLMVPFDLDEATCKDPQLRGTVATAQEESK